MSKRRTAAPSTSTLERRARAAELRRVQLAKQHRDRLVLLAGIASGVLLLVVIIVLVTTSHRGGRATSASRQVLPSSVATLGPATTERTAVVVPDSSGIPGVVAYAVKTGRSGPAGALQNDHVPGSVTYSVTPPVGGQHNAAWLNCGVYTAPVPAERAVHDLEHGAVWITYRPSLAAGQVAALRALALRQPQVPDGNGDRWRYTDLTPWTSDALPAPVVLSAWGHQLRADSATDPRLQRFIDAFRAHKGVTPELGSPCGGVPDEIGGRPDAP